MGCKPLLRIFLPSVLLLSPVCAQDRQSDSEERQRALWSQIKRALLSEEGQKYFEESVQNALLPPLKGTVVSARPSDKPQIIVIGLSDKTTREATLLLIEPGDGRDGRRPAAFDEPIAAGDEVEFMGIAVSFTKDPFMLAFDVALDKLKHVPAKQSH